MKPIALRRRACDASMPSVSSVGRISRPPVLADVELAEHAALRHDQDRRYLIRHEQRRQRVRRDRKARCLHHDDAPHSGHPGAGDHADRLVLARRVDRDEIVVGGDALEQRRQHVVGDIGDRTGRRCPSACGGSFRTRPCVKTRPRSSLTSYVAAADRRVMKRHAGRLTPSLSARRLQRWTGMRGWPRPRAPGAAAEKRWRNDDDAQDCSIAARRVAALLAAAGPAVAQSYPARPITLVVPFAPGGSASTAARSVADKMSETLGQQIVIDNRGGAGGTVATRAVAKSPARRLHAAGGHQRDGRDVAQPVSKPRLRSAQGLRADRPDRGHAEPDRGASELSRPFAGRADQDRQGRPRRRSPTARPAPARSTTSRSSSSPTGPA